MIIIIAMNSRVNMARELFQSQHLMLGKLKQDFDNATFLISESIAMCNKILIPLIRQYPDKAIKVDDTFSIVIPGGEMFSSDDSLHEYSVSVMLALTDHKYKVVIIIDDFCVHIATPVFNKCVCERTYWYEDIDAIIKAINDILTHLPKTLTPKFVMSIIESHKKEMASQSS